jgi:hypothetical protein
MEKIHLTPEEVAQALNISRTKVFELLQVECRWIASLARRCFDRTITEREDVAAFYPPTAKGSNQAPGLTATLTATVTDTAG